jgi:hypothetical protein
MAEKNTCVGFSSTAKRQYRKVDDKLLVRVHEACSARCENCRGNRPDSFDPILVRPWELSWRCSEPDEFTEECGDSCCIILLTIVRSNG